ncbi:hypothetical protein D3C81_1238700 [compost metagenome]
MANPTCFANSSAPLPTIITCSDFSITALAAEIGFLIVVTPATAPAAKDLPSMMEASSSLCPSCVKTAPFPALNKGESSITWIADSTASKLDLPSCNF